MTLRTRLLSRVLVVVWLVLLAAAVLLGVPDKNTGRTLWSPARVLFIPDGLVLTCLAGLCWRRRQPHAAAWLALIGLAMVGIGAHRAWPGPWTALAIPATAAGAARSAYAGWRGGRDPWTAAVARTLVVRRRPPKHPLRRARLCFAGAAVLCAAGAVLAAAAM